VLQDYMDEYNSQEVDPRSDARPPIHLEEEIENPQEKVKPIKGIPFLDEIPFYSQAGQDRLAQLRLHRPGQYRGIYRKRGIFRLSPLLAEMKPEGNHRTIKKSGLRGRGGGGFPTGIKWESCRKHHGERYVICNADEGDPGAYMDRSILEGRSPQCFGGDADCGICHRIFRQGFIYVRNEYPLAVKRLVSAIKQAEAFGFLGENIADSEFGFQVKISTGAGAFVCGESTALMASLEGKVGRPRAKYVHTVEKGFREKPLQPQ
jgi:NADH:ubiquinone oxidoreductase subunit F (NADH-binding)